MTPRLYLSVLALLLLFPALALPIDSADHAQGTGSPLGEGDAAVSVAALRSGSVYRYDATLQGPDEREEVARAVVIRVGEPVVRGFIDGQTAKAVPIEFDLLPLPWSPSTGLHETHGDAPAESHGETQRLWFALPHGALLQHDVVSVAYRESWDEGEIYGVDEKGMRWTRIETARSERLAATPEELFLHGVWPGRTMGPLAPGSPLDLAAGRPPAGYDQVATHDGRTIYGLSAPASRLAPWGCLSPAPLTMPAAVLPQHVPVVPRGHAHEATDVGPAEPMRVWVDPGVPFPVALRCPLPATFDGLHGHGHHESAGTGMAWTLSYRLAEYDIGGAALPFDVAPRASAPWRPLPRLTTLDAGPHGVPPEVGAGLDLSLSDALAAWRSHPEWDDFSRRGPLRLENAAYHVTEKEMRAGDAAPEGAGPLEQGPQATLERDEKATWSLAFTNGAGAMLSGSVTRVDSSRALPQEHRTEWHTGVTLQPQAHHPGGTRGPVPTRLAPIDLQLMEALDVEGLTPADFGGETGGVLEYTAADAGAEGLYQVRLPVKVIEEKRSTSWSTHRATDGATLLQGRTTETESDDPPPDPEVVSASPPLEGELSALRDARPAGAAPADPAADAPAYVAPSAGVFVMLGAAFLVPTVTWAGWIGLRRVVPTLPLLGLYAKVTRDRLLDHDTRRLIVEYVMANPGAHLQEIRQVAAIGLGTATHHLALLERNGFLSSVKSGRRRCYFPATRDTDADARDGLAVLGSDAARRVFAAISERPGIRQRELAEVLGVSQTAVIFHVRRLEASDMVWVQRVGREVAYHPTLAGTVAHRRIVARAERPTPSVPPSRSPRRPPSDSTW